MTEYVDDELPLPPFADMFGEGLVSSKKKAKKLRESAQADETTGRWTPEEHRLFLEGIMLYGKDWKKMQPLIKSRSLVQIRTHAQKVFKKIGLKKALLMSAGKRAKLTEGGVVGGAGDGIGNQGDNEDFDGDDTAVGAEELQLLQQMSQQMMQEEEEEQQRRSRQQNSQSGHGGSTSQHAPLHAGQHAQHYAQAVEYAHTDGAPHHGTALSSSSAAGTGPYNALPGAGMPGSSAGNSADGDNSAHAGNLSLLPEHAFHQTYNAAFAAFSTNPEYAAQGNYVNSGNDQGLNVILQYASNSDGLSNNMVSSNFAPNIHQ